MYSTVLRGVTSAIMDATARNNSYVTILTYMKIITDRVTETVKTL